MQLNDLKIAYDIVNNFQKYDTLSKPPKINKLDYKVHCIDGISKFEWDKDIEEVKPNTLEYILYYLHNIDSTMIVDTLIALLYYWKFRKRKSLKMEQVYHEMVNHYTAQNEPYKRDDKTKKGSCVYLIKIEIGSKVLYKVGKTKDLHQRMVNLQSNINANYSFVSVGITVEEVLYCDNHDEIEEKLLREIRNMKIKKHKFFFKGHTESFESDEVINVFKKVVKDFN